MQKTTNRLSEFNFEWMTEKPIKRKGTSNRRHLYLTKSIYFSYKLIFCSPFNFEWQDKSCKITFLMINVQNWMHFFLENFWQTMINLFWISKLFLYIGSYEKPLKMSEFFNSSINFLITQIIILNEVSLYFMDLCRLLLVNPKKFLFLVILNVNRKFAWYCFNAEK